MATFLTGPIDVTPSTLNSYVDVDLSSLIPYGSSGAIFLCRNTDGNNRQIGWRKKGSTDTWKSHAQSGGGNNSVSSFACGVDSNRVCQLYTITSNCKFYVVAALDSQEAVLFDNAIDVTPGVTGSWQNVDISSHTSGSSIGAFLSVSTGGNGTATGARKNGSIDDRHTDVFGGGMICGVDGSQICQVYAGTGDTIRLQGYIVSQAVLATNATDVSLSTTGSYQSLPALPAGAVGGIYESISTANSQNYYIRKSGNTEDLTGDLNVRHGWLVVACDSSRICEEKINSTAVDTFQMGYFTASPLVPQPASLTLTGDIPVLSLRTNYVPSAGSLTLTGNVPSVQVAITFTPGATSLTLAGFAPTLTVSQKVIFTPDPGSLLMAGDVPTITYATTKSPTAGTLSLQGYMPTILVGANVIPNGGTLTLTGHAPDVSMTGNAYLSPAASSLTLTGYSLQRPPYLISSMGTVIISDS